MTLREVIDTARERIAGTEVDSVDRGAAHLNSMLGREAQRVRHERELRRHIDEPHGSLAEAVTRRFKALR